MTDETTNVTPPRRVTRPDRAADTPSPTADNLPVPDTMPVADEQPVVAEQVSSEEELTSVSLDGPFRAESIRVLDSIGRVFCFVGEVHRTLPVREKMARLIADKLNA